MSIPMNGVSRCTWSVVIGSSGMLILSVISYATWATNGQDLGREVEQLIRDDVVVQLPWQTVGRSRCCILYIPTRYSDHVHQLLEGDGFTPSDHADPPASGTGSRSYDRWPFTFVDVFDVVKVEEPGMVIATLYRGPGYYILWTQYRERL